jgi:hypothetical protein
MQRYYCCERVARIHKEKVCENAVANSLEVYGDQSCSSLIDSVISVLFSIVLTLTAGLWILSGVHSQIVFSRGWAPGGKRSDLRLSRASKTPALETRDKIQYTPMSWRHGGGQNDIPNPLAHSSYKPHKVSSD